ncbi:hypothetical protein vseg_009743 [Gypsophila vaccaria]
MRIMIKGGVWKNTEDEILKAAVMKYGKNQWARISSLLVRKSAKQCKARWYEWLDPSIKKTEWTREEDEKLLHLAKLMPTQWRTIAPIVGRTPSQCLERYEKLLDSAVNDVSAYEQGDDPRKLRPGEIDPNPESKPARPDPVDMDEDEKEMLSEARARLANTRGKKAKRKAREKQLEEARRLASLQKRRELKAAGIDPRQRKRKRRGIDYNAEIPFEKRPPPGFYDTVDEDKPVEQPNFPTTIEELEGERRADKEARLRKQDIAKNKIAQRQDAPAAIMQANKLNDPESVRKRSKLMLPPPQISDQELEEIARMGYATDILAGNQEHLEGSGATRALLGDYSQTPRPGMTPMRTPQRTPAGKGDAIMMEAENLARLRESQTPLLGGNNPDLHPSDFSGVTPKRREVQTPNPMLTPLTTPGGAGLTPRLGMTPSRDGNSFGLTPKGTPIRDELHINEGLDVHDSGKLEMRRQAELKRNLRMGLSGLPDPKNEYEVVVRPALEDAEEQEEKIEEDMSDRIARVRAEEEARLQALLRKRSKVLQRELPRPPIASVELVRQSLMKADEDKSSFAPPTDIEQADEIIRKELLSLLEHDNAKYPLNDKEKKKGDKRAARGIPIIEDFEEAVLKEASSLVEEEAQYLRRAMGREEDSLDEYVDTHRTCMNDMMYFPTREAYGFASVAETLDRLSALQNDFENVKRKLDDDNKKAQRSEKKVDIRTNGYKAREAKLREQIELTFKQMNTASTELDCFLALQRQEKSAAALRIKGLWEEVQKQKELETTLQKRYGDLIAEVERIQPLMEQYRLQAQQLEELEAKKRAEELASEELKKAAPPSSEASEPVSMMEVDSSNDVKPVNDDDKVNEVSMEKETSIDGDVSTGSDTQDTPLASEIPPPNSSSDAQVAMDQDVEDTKAIDNVVVNPDNIVEEAAQNGGLAAEEAIPSNQNELVEGEGEGEGKGNITSQTDEPKVNEPVSEGDTDVQV